MVTYANISPKMVNPRDLAGNAEEEEVKTISKHSFTKQRLLNTVSTHATTVSSIVCLVKACFVLSFEYIHSDIVAICLFLMLLIVYMITFSCLII